MKFGCFGLIRQISLIEKAGFDAAELDFCEIAALSEEDFRQLSQQLKDSSLDFSVFSGLIPLTERFHSESFDRAYWLEHIRRGAGRVSQLGACMIPFGAGKCRSIPDGCTDRNAAKERIRSLVSDICGILAPYGITLVIEPLGPANSNYINYIAEAVQFVSVLSLPNCKTMCDLRHMHKLGEDMDEIVKYRNSVLHAHIDYPEGDKRFFPNPKDGFDYAPYFRALSKAGYDGILTIEATAYTDFFREAREGLMLLKEYRRQYC
ncbi:sugar phosphate isomerase/epimerase family protein [uncultured Clostridium sp.]|uniref:sugar phosphate isomerase/epimerase family protein n=1 Tax=uncultured Clostridium sp. TaxID=59620 RepID=UPI0025F5AB36|nr:sugar phosphate isomerase/epimerase family protein [uncultured Clostridium sp.]